MPQIKAAVKALRVAARRRAINDKWRDKIRLALKNIRLAGTDEAKKTEAVKHAISTFDRAARRHVLHWRTAARRKSRLSSPRREPA